MDKATGVRARAGSLAELRGAWRQRASLVSVVPLSGVDDVAGQWSQADSSARRCGSQTSLGGVDINHEPCGENPDRHVNPQPLLEPLEGSFGLASGAEG